MSKKSKIENSQTPPEDGEDDKLALEDMKKVFGGTEPTKGSKLRTGDWYWE